MRTFVKSYAKVEESARGSSFVIHTCVISKLATGRQIPSATGDCACPAADNSVADTVAFTEESSMPGQVSAV